MSSFYYCSIHRVRHSILHLGNGFGEIEEPIVGECALLFYADRTEAIPRPSCDQVVFPPTEPPSVPVPRDGRPQPSPGDPDATAPFTSEGGIGEVRPEAEAEQPQTVKVPMGRRRTDAVLAVVPYDTPAYLAGFTFRQGAPGPRRRHQRNILFCRYEDALSGTGLPAVQPTANTQREIEHYLAPLDKAAGRHDVLVRRVRDWSCWAQGFEFLEQETRWYLALKSRRELREVMHTVEDLVEHFGLARTVTMPDVDWMRLDFGPGCQGVDTG
ncbi:hypothetical protein JX266_005949 [Neoarthrinium moseri]|nr:hypothetical protein JX266_005949 [Neoarthrinium moseri]